MKRWTIRLVTPAWMHKEDKEFTTNNRHEAMNVAYEWKAKCRGCVQVIDNTTNKINPFF